MSALKTKRWEIGFTCKNRSKSWEMCASQDQEIISDIVIDNGSSMIKAGFAGDVQPLHTIATINTIESNDMYINHPIQRGIVQNWDDMEQIWSNLFYDTLKIQTEEHNVLMTERLFNPKSNSEKMAEILFETFNVPGFYVRCSEILPLFSEGRITGTVLDIGHGVSSVVSIYEGYIIPNSSQRINFAGFDLNEYLIKALTESDIFDSKLKIIENMKEKLCYVASNYDTELKKRSSEIQKTYELPDGTTFNITSERFKCGEILFQNNIHKMVHKSILNCDINLRKNLYNNIILSGGTTLLEGFAQRLQTEVIGKIIAQPERKYAAWNGGSILASMAFFDEICITKQQYQETGTYFVRECNCDINWFALDLESIEAFDDDIYSESNNKNLDFEKKKHIQLQSFVNHLENDNANLKAIGTEYINEEIEEEKIDDVSVHSTLRNILKWEIENEILKQNIDSKLKETKLLQQNNTLETRNDCICQQIQEMKDTLNKLTLEYNELRENDYNGLDLSNYIRWSGKDVIDWIMSLDQNKYQQYKDILCQVFKQQNVDGSCLEYVEISDVDDWGIKDLKTKTILLKNIKQLIK